MNYRKIILILCLSIFLSAEKNANAQTTTFTYTGSVQTWAVPCNVTSITIDCYGAQGIGMNGETPGYGGEARGVLTVTPGQVLNIYVGGQAGWNGGGLGETGANGGDGSDVRYPGNTLADRIIVAGGGGGAGGDNWQCTSGVHGNGGGGIVVGSNFVGGDGGQGYTFSSGCGTVGGTNGGSGGSGCHGGGGGGAGMNTGGAGATATCGVFVADSGKLGQGGASYNAPNCNSEGTGGGGGGYYGGGGAAGYSCGAGQGGGGSSWTGTLASPFFSFGTWTGKGEIIITQNNIPTPVTDSAYLLNDVSCNGGSDGKVSVAVTGGAASTFTYSWAPSGETTATATGLSAGTYTITATGACGVSASSIVSVSEPTPLVATASAVTNVLCNGDANGSATSSGSGGDLTSAYYYLWSPSFQTNAAATGLSAGTYTVTVSDFCGGSATATATITEPNPLSVVASVTSDVQCHGLSNGSASSTVTFGTAPYTYTWSPSGGNNPTANGLTAGRYTLNVVDHNGCTGSASVTITQPVVLRTSVGTVTNVNCNGGADGSTTSTTTGGTTPYAYVWAPSGGNASTASGLMIGTYTLTVTDANGCSVSARTGITQPSALIVVANETPANGHCTGSASAMANGGVVPYTYAWTNGVTTAYNYGICDTTYCCKVTDNHGCSTTVCINVTSDAGVDNVTSDAGKITIYPNPNSGQFTIESSASNGASSVEIYNVLGEMVYTTSLNSNKGGNTTINISNQPGGIYLYRVVSTTNGSLLGEGKVILQK